MALDEKLTLSPGGSLTIPPLPAWQIPADPTWREDPYHDAAWAIRYESLRYVDHLVGDWCRDGDQALLERARFLMTDWLADNQQDAAARWAWYDHSVAWRTFVLIDAIGVMPAETWLMPAIEEHGAWLVEHSDGAGNHALNANRGLLAAGCFLGRQDWIDLAVRHIDGLLRESVDAQGVTNEQSVMYQDYNYGIYNEARDELVACGQPESPYFHRITLMPRLLAFATLPNGEYEMLGDTPKVKAPGIEGTWAEFAATGGRSGPKPNSTDAIFARGFAFVRSGWGENRPFRDELELSLRFGAGREFHGHDDGGSITLYGLGSRLLFDAGKNTFQGAKPWTQYFIGRTAHNVVTVDGLDYEPDTTTTMQSALGGRDAFFAMSNDGYAGVSNVRTVLYSRARRYVIVEDRMSSADWHTYRQLWHLGPNADPRVDGRAVLTNGPRGNVEILQLLGGTSRVLTGSADPRQGWLTFDYQQVAPAPAVEQSQSGRVVRYVTILLPFRANAPDVSGRVVALFSDGYTVDVTIKGKTERWTVHGTNVSVSDLVIISPPPPPAAPPPPYHVAGGMIAI